MADAKTLYDEDFVAWSEEQAAALRSAAHGGSNRRLDWENLAEEIEGLGISQRSALRSQISRIIEHHAKLAHSPAVAPRNGWRRTIRQARLEIERLLEDSPSLRRDVARLISAETDRSIKIAIADLEEHGKLDPATLARIRATTYSEEQILGDWFPPEA